MILVITIHLVLSVFISGCYHFVFKGVTHDRSATQNRTPYSDLLNTYETYFLKKLSTY